MECFLSAKHLHTFSHLRLRRGLDLLPPGSQVIKPQLRQPEASGKWWSLDFGPSSGLHGPLSKPLESERSLYLKKVLDSIRL